jgi:hypothetical protein
MDAHHETLVRVQRDPGAPLDGFILASGDKWALLARRGDSLNLDGYTLFRWRDVTKVRTRSKYQSLSRNTLERLGQWPPALPGGAPPVLDTTTGLIGWLAEEQAVVTIHLERWDDEVAFVGVPVGVKDKKLVLWEIDATGAWHDKPTEWRFRDLTAVDFGDAYAGHVLQEAVGRGAPTGLLGLLRA